MRMGDDPFENSRQQMMAEIVTEAVLTAGHTGRAAFGARVLDAIGAMPRHEFVPIELQPYAYLNRPLPIGYEKTVSQPFIVALMTDLLDLEGTPGQPSLRRRAEQGLELVPPALAQPAAGGWHDDPAGAGCRRRDFCGCDVQGEANLA